jgi:hypothetical protein
MSDAPAPEACMRSDQARIQIQRVMEQCPKITVNGLGFGNLIELLDHELRFQDARLEMLSECCCRQFCSAVSWLAQCGRTKGIARGETSYGLKHEAERWAGHYISNGMLIAAAIHLGFIVLGGKAPDSPIAHLNISARRRPRRNMAPCGDW